MRALLILVLSALPAAATQDGWPALFDVVGVASDDVLNIRSAPGTAGEIVGSLPHDGSDIEVIRPTEHLTWGLVNARERTGWVSLSYLQRQPDQWDGKFPAIRHCVGTEPFWSLALDPPQIRLETPDIEPRTGLISSMHASLSRRDRFAYGGSFFPNEAGSRDILLSIAVETCSDGMSDREYGIAVDMLLTRPDLSGDDSVTGLYSGCCSIQPPAASR